MGIGAVETKFGKISGIECSGKYEGITLFKGIPYAAPPVGDLRWCPPVDPEPWTGVRECVKSGPIPIQELPGSERYLAEFTFTGVPEYSEDCLYMDICAPALSDREKHPVYMWFHGGGLSNCYAYEDEFDPREFARKGVICILVEQRLNIFGYMALPQLSEEQGGTSGNYGLMDQIKALDWVYENIARFGGDPDNITVGGQSGGSQKALCMAATPESGGRVKRVVAESGLKWMQTYPTMNDAEQLGRRYLEYIGVSPDASLEELRALPAWEIFKAAPRGVLPASLTWDGKWVPCENFLEAFGKYLGGVDILVGTNMGEASMLARSVAGLNKDEGAADVKTIKTAEDFYAHYKFLLGPLYKKYDFESLVKVTDADAFKTAMRLSSLGLAGFEGTNMSRNVMLNRIFGRYMAGIYPHNKIYTYLFSHMMPIHPYQKGTTYDPELVGAWHSSELWYVFNSLKENYPPHRPWREVDYKVAEMCNNYWINFIKSGNPNGAGLPAWPASGENLVSFELCEEPNVIGDGKTLDRLIYEFTTQEYAKELKQAGAI